MIETTPEINKYKFVGGVADGEMRAVAHLIPVLLVAAPSSVYYGLEDTVPQTALRTQKTHKYHRVDMLRDELTVEYWHDSVYKLHQEKLWQDLDAKRAIREIRKQVGKLESYYE